MNNNAPIKVICLDGELSISKSLYDRSEKLKGPGGLISNIDIETLKSIINASNPDVLYRIPLPESINPEKLYDYFPDMKPKEVEVVVEEPINNNIITIDDIDDDEADIKLRKIQEKQQRKEFKRLEKERKMKEKVDKKLNSKLIPMKDESDNVDISGLSENHQKAFIFKNRINTLYNQNKINIYAKLTKKKLYLVDTRRKGIKSEYEIDNVKQMNELDTILTSLNNEDELEILTIIKDFKGSVLKAIIEGKSYIEKYYSYTKREGKGFIKRNGDRIMMTFLTPGALLSITLFILAL